MFHIFSKKRFLVDLLNGFVDIHNHILPGIDDGAKNTTESIALIKGFEEFGVQDFVATPHIMQNYYPNNQHTIAESLLKLKNELLKNDLTNVAINAAAEHMIDANFETILEKGEIIPIKKNYLLIEMSYLQPSINFDSAIQKIASERYFPILAHPERYVYLKSGSKKYRKYKKQGLLFQLNLLSLGEYYGKEVQRKALKLIDEGLIDFLASDVHNPNQLKNLKELKIGSKTAISLIPLIEKTIYNFY
ncbi:histidinol phosphatase [Flavobacteriaceae bacterium TP-CH-4]|uniref:protein-tyrosine-phosphatase n=1 Tax=Pelagihabitans pacificus TaxID=2696054 RepID=A0A967AW70_9FLAO|nr:CpsB/CapC family capsule biosynthesis tyrosine phosphatase [Pelagihabitans pacificus]NHF61551.1 histidinol phosphatase [Pelagihabitans pacificus]